MSEQLKEYANALTPELYRGQSQAVRCRWLHFTPLHRTAETIRPQPVVQAASPLILGHENGRGAQIGTQLVPMTVWPNTPIIALVCVSPKMVDWTRSLMPEQVRQVVNDVEVNLEICSCCAFWEEREAQ